jgi:putative membrane protein
MHAEIPSLDELRGLSPRSAAPIIAGTSLAMLGLLVVVLYGHPGARSAPGWVACLPGLNAALNATSAAFLLLAYRAVRRRDFVDHAHHMLRALVASGVFLVSYVVYHSVHGDSRFGGHGGVRPIYFFILITHVGLSAVALPLILSSFFLSLSGRYPMHKRLSRYTLPIWLYVSVTGVLVFVFLKAFG